MTQQGYAHITILADRTGSTGTVTDPGRTRAMDFTDGIKSLIADHTAAPGRTTFSLVEFMHSGSMKLARLLWFDQGSSLETWSIKPYGNTPLLDAIGTVITDTGTHLEAMPEDQRPERVYFVIATDGEENSSREYTLEQVKTMIAHQRDAYQWEFVFIGAGIDAFAEAGGMGIGAQGTLRTNAGSSVAMAAAYSSTSDAMLRSRASGRRVSYTDEERTASK